ncbi:hypothetical protein JNK13_08775 [bacterium]|nr:hypothetical protein [bacterium]
MNTLLEVRVERVNSLNNSFWDEFVDQSNNGTIFHKLKFLSYHPTDRFEFHNLKFTDHNGNIKAILTGVEKDGKYISCLGASYGSLICRDLSLIEYEKIFDCLEDYARQMDWLEIRLTPPPLFYQKNYNQVEEFLLHYKGYIPTVSLITHAADLSRFTSREDIDQLISDAHYRAIKKSFNSEIRVNFSDDWDSFYPMLLENKSKFDAHPTHTLEELVKLHQLFPMEIKLLNAYDSLNNNIAALVLFSCNTEAVLAFYIAHYYRYQQLRAVNRLFLEAMVWAKESGYNWLDFGVSMNTQSDNLMEPSRSLIFFKEGTGAQGFRRTTYVKQLK